MPFYFILEKGAGDLSRMCGSCRSCSLEKEACPALCSCPWVGWGLSSPATAQLGIQNSWSCKVSRAGGFGITRANGLQQGSPKRILKTKGKVPPTLTEVINSGF